jgi:hypothetical protein
MDTVLLSEVYELQLKLAPFYMQLSISVFSDPHQFEFAVVLCSVHINSSVFRDHKLAAPKAARDVTEDSTFHPLPALFKLIGLAPFKKVTCLLLLSLVRFILSKNEQKRPQVRSSWNG